MARTIIGVNDAKAVKRWATGLAYDTSHKSYYNQRFMGKGADAEVPVQILTDLESDAGEQVSYDLLAELKMAPVEGEDTLEGKEESQKFYTDQIWIDQARCGVNTGGRMTRKRTLHNLREKAKRQQSGWWGRLIDELLFIYISGARGINSNFLLPTGYTGRANNTLYSPDSNHVMYGGDATAFNNVDSADKFDLRLVDRAKTRADSQGGGATDIPVLQPCKIDGNETFVCVMHTFQEDDLRSDTDTGQWLDIQKAAAGAEGKTLRCSRVRLACTAASFCTVIATSSVSIRLVQVRTWKLRVHCSWVRRLPFWPTVHRAPISVIPGTKKLVTTGTRWSFLRRASSVSRRFASIMTVTVLQIWTSACLRWIPLRPAANPMGRDLPGP